MQEAERKVLNESRTRSAIQHSAFNILHFAFRILHFAFRILHSRISHLHSRISHKAISMPPFIHLKPSFVAT
jgi:hypothetical protein